MNGQAGSAVASAAGETDIAMRSARLFRRVLDAMARPAEPCVLADCPAPPQPESGAQALSPAAFAVLTLLSDADAPWWLASDVAAERTAAELAFRTGARAVHAPGRAAFLCGGWAALAAEALPHAAIGTADYPDRGATLLVEVAALDDGGAPDAFGRHVAELAGPGLKAPRRLGVTGVDDRFWPFLTANRQRFPLGVDLVLCAGDRIVGLPRSLSVVG